MTNDSSEPNESPASLQQLIAELDRELAENPTSVFAHVQRGNAYVQLQEYQRAISDYTRALELDPHYTNAYRQRGQAYAALGYHRWAAADFSRAEELDLQKQHLVLPAQPVAHPLPRPTAPTTAAAPSGRRVYRARHRLLWALFCSFVFLCTLFGALFFLAGLLGAVQGTVPLWEAMLFLPVGLFMLVLVPVTGFWISDVWKARLIVAPEGITCYGNGYRLYTPWWNIRNSGSMQLGVRQVSGLWLERPAVAGLSLAEGLRQQRPALELSGWLRLEYKALPLLRTLAPLGGRLPRSVDEDMRRYASMISSMIPISLYVQQRQQGEMTRLIAQYAPQAFGLPGRL